MAAERKTVLKGISEVGAVRAAADVPWGKTAPNGVTFAFSGNDLEVESGQSPVLEECLRISDKLDITVRLIYADMLNLAEALGLDISSRLTGDLQGAPATAEVLDLVDGALGEVVDALYIISPGPGSTRRFEIPKVRRRAGVSFELSRNDIITLEFTLTAIRDDGGSSLGTITDTP